MSFAMLELQTTLENNNSHNNNTRMQSTICARFYRWTECNIQIAQPLGKLDEEREAKNSPEDEIRNEMKRTPNQQYIAPIKYRTDRAHTHTRSVYAHDIVFDIHFSALPPLLYVLGVCVYRKPVFIKRGTRPTNTTRCVCIANSTVLICD